jgi:hypothetical protein
MEVMKVMKVMEVERGVTWRHNLSALLLPISPEWPRSAGSVTRWSESAEGAKGAVARFFLTYITFITSITYITRTKKR